MKFLDLGGLQRFLSAFLEKVNAIIDAKVAGVFKVTGVVDYQGQLPTEGNVVNNVYVVRYKGASGTIPYNAEFYWTGLEWDLLGVVNEVDLSGYVAREDGKGLSTNDYNATDKSIVQRINNMSLNGLSFSNTVAEPDLLGYAVCSTGGAAAAKAVSVSANSFKLIVGSQFTVKFAIANTAASPTLNVNATGAKPIFYKGAAIVASHLKANVYSFVYDGTNWVLIGEVNTDTTYTAATDSVAGLMSTEDKTKLDGIETAATADSALTNEEIDSLFA
jgi:hypothetical protein